MNIDASHPVRVDGTDDAPITLLNRGDVVYYGYDTAVSAANKVGSLSAGDSITLTVPTWIKSSSVSHLDVFFPVSRLSQTIQQTVNQTVVNNIQNVTNENVDPTIFDGINGQFATIGSRLTSVDSVDSSQSAAIDAINNSMNDSLLPHLKLSRSQAFSVTNNTNPAQTIDFDTVSSDSHGFDTSAVALSTPTSITIPSTGLYKLQIRGQFAHGAGGYRLFQFKKNNSTVIADANRDPSADGATAEKLNLGCDEFLTAGDTIQVQVFQNANGGGAMNLASTPTSPVFTISKQKMVGGQGGGSGTGGGGTFTALYVQPTYPSSIFRTSIANLPTSGKAVHANSAGIVNFILTHGNGNININETAGKASGQDFSHPVYVAVGGDPLWTFTQRNFTNPLVVSGTVRIPANAMPASGSDGSFGIVQSDGVTEYDFWSVQNVDHTNHTFDCGFCRKTDVTTGQATSGQNNTGGITAAGFAHGLGIPTRLELRAGLIPHAIFLAISGWGGPANRVYPSSTTYTSPPAGSGYTADPNAPAMGAHLRLKSTYDPTAHGFADWKVTYLTAIRDYGFYVGDNGGSTMSMHIESERPYLALGQSPTCIEDLDTFFSKAPGSAWDISTGVDWAGNLQVLVPPNT